MLIYIANLHASQTEEAKIFLAWGFDDFSFRLIKLKFHLDRNN
jgi:hypothetical protein